MLVIPCACLFLLLVRLNLPLIRLKQRIRRRRRLRLLLLLLLLRLRRLRFFLRKSIQHELVKGKEARENVHAQRNRQEFAVCINDLLAAGNDRSKRTLLCGERIIKVHVYQDQTDEPRQLENVWSTESAPDNLSGQCGCHAAQKNDLTDDVLRFVRVRLQQRERGSPNTEGVRSKERHTQRELHEERLHGVSSRSNCCGDFDHNNKRPSTKQRSTKQQMPEYLPATGHATGLTWCPKLHMVWEHVSQKIQAAGFDAVTYTLPIMGYEHSTEHRKRRYLIGQWRDIAAAFVNASYPRRFHEMFSSPVPCWVPLDLDGKNMKKEIMDENVVKCVSKIEEQARAWGFPVLREALVLDGSIENKQSRHVIIRVLCMNIVHAGTLVKHALRGMDPSTPNRPPKYVDVSIYGINSSLRTAYSSAFEKKTIFQYTPVLPLTVESWLESLVTYVSPEDFLLANQKPLKVPSEIADLTRAMRRMEIACVNDDDVTEISATAALGWTRGNLEFLRNALESAVLIRGKHNQDFELKMDSEKVKVLQNTDGLICYTCAIRYYVCQSKQANHENNRCYLRLILPPFYPRQGFTIDTSRYPAVYVYCQHPNCLKASWLDEDLSEAAAATFTKLCEAVFEVPDEEETETQQEQQQT